MVMRAHTDTAVSVNDNFLHYGYSAESSIDLWHLPRLLANGTSVYTLCLALFLMFLFEAMNLNFLLGLASPVKSLNCAHRLPTARIKDRHRVGERRSRGLTSPGAPLALGTCTRVFA